MSALPIGPLGIGHDEPRARAPEPNPFLGCRSIRFCLRHLPMFKTQIRAILRASIDSRMSMLFPLITNLIELRQAKTVVRDVMEDLEEEGVEHRTDISIGMMVETPSAALMADAFAREVDFFSIGTNDLVQYTLAVDRGNERVASLYQPAHPAILRLLRQVIEVGREREIEVAVCGEICGEANYTLLLLGMGLKELSLAPSMIPQIKKVIRSLTMERALEVARTAMTMSEASQTERFLHASLRQVLPMIF